MSEHASPPGVTFWDFKAEAVSCVVGVEGAAYFALADGSVARVSEPASGEADRFGLHGGAIVSMTATPGGGVITGGDDGRLVQLAPSGETVELAALPGRWIDHLASSPSTGALAMASAKNVFYFPGPESSGIDLGVLPSSVGGLSFSPDGHVLAATHYGGVTLWDFTGDETGLSRIELPGLSLGLAFDPRGRLLAVANQEKRIHLLDLAGGGMAELAGYARKPLSLCFAVSGETLLTSGNAGFTLWEIEPDSQAMPEQSVFAAQEETHLVRVAAHPAFPVALGGFSEGSVFIAELTSKAAVFAFNLEASPVTALTWSADGMFAFGGSASGVCFAALLPALLGA